MLMSSRDTSVRIQNKINQHHPYMVGGEHNLSHIRIADIDDGKFMLTADELAAITSELNKENYFFRTELGDEFGDPNRPTAPAVQLEDVLISHPELLFNLQNNLSNNTITRLKDLAQEEESSDLNFAYEVMRLIISARPGEKFLREKVEEYEQRLVEPNPRVEEPKGLLRRLNPFAKH